jgi:hypothetical protein
VTKKILGVGALKRLQRALTRMVSGAFEKSSVHVSSEAFQKALAPIERYRSKMKSTSRGRGWWPRRATYRPMQMPNGIKMAPREGYELDWHGSLRRTAAKVNKCRKRRARAACAA